MNRIQVTLDKLAAGNRKALVSYIVAGDPDLASTVPLMHQLVKSGTDIIEIGVPFSDPSAEGPTIQRAHERALANRVGLGQILELIKRFREQDSNTPVLLMGYANPIEWMGYERFCQTAKEAGADGALTVDIPPEEAAPLNEVLEANGLFNVFLLAPTTTDGRITAIANMASGFLYYVSLKGVTGAASLDIASVEEKLTHIRARTKLPVCVGFGIKDAATAKSVVAIADGVVIGSAIVDTVFKAGSLDKALIAIDDLLTPIRAAIDE
jgi:tryptophan synthase alpha chain